MGMCGVCAGVRECAQVCMGVCRYARVRAGMHGCKWVSKCECAWVCLGVCGCGRVCVGMCWYAQVCAGVHRCELVCEWICMGVRGMNFQNFFWRIESLHQRTLIRILYEFFNVLF